MSLETETPVRGPASPKPPPDKKPVIIYIMILFIAAFLLMAISFFAHQRSNAQVLGELQNSVSAMQEVQADQEQLLALQGQLDSAEKELEDLKRQLSEKDEAIGEAQRRLDAMQELYSLQQCWLVGDIDGCLIALQDMEDRGLAELLPDTGAADVTTPAQRYEELKDAVLNR